MSPFRFTPSSSVALLLSVLCACQAEPPERAPPLDVADKWSSGLVSSSGPGDGDEGGEGGAAGEVRGSVRRFIGTDFSSTEAYDEPALIWIMERLTTQDVVKVPYDGTEFFTERSASPKWLAVVPEFDVDHLDSVTLWDGRSEPEPAVVARSALAEIMGGLIASDTPNDARAQLFVRVVAEDGVTGVAGVIPTVTGGPDLAFLDGGTWQDLDDSTGDSGQFLAYNVSAAALPGKDVKVLLSGSLDAEFSVRLAAGATTMVTYVER
ncbi:MAG TPA: hypothetical protein VN764_02545 [Polyangiaceae bacterium]|nr:hypothetical protein [Polyangiaceae bacterium]